MLELVTDAGSIAAQEVPVLVVGAFAPPSSDVAAESESETDPVPVRRPELTDGAAALLGADGVDVLVALGFEAGEGSVVRVAPRDGRATVLVVGLGPRARCGTETLRRAAGSAARATQDVTALATDLLHVPLDGGPDADAGPETIACAVAEGLVLGAYRFDTYRTKPAPRRLVRAVLVGAEAAHERGVQRARVTAAAVTWVRDLVNTPPKDKRPVALAARVVDGLGDDRIVARVLDEADLEAGGYGGILGVGGGSSVKPSLVELRWRPEGATRHVAIVGKGITFDTGGYSLKPTSGQETMKSDMAGAATVAAVVRAVAALELPVEVTAVLCLAENLVSGDAQRVSDVVRMRDGTTVEVMNTDAEGRLVLGDGISHAAELGADTIVDVATLTGAVVVALGDLIGGVMSNDDGLADELVAEGRSAGEPMWRLPLAVDEYGKRVEGTVADLRNVGGREAGSIFGALFLHRFVPKGVRWAHLDIAGIAWRDAAGPYHQKGGTGSPARTLIAWLERVARS